ncbi:MAG: TonB-dependent receptor, partial [Bacteroidota bacterium]
MKIKILKVLSAFLIGCCLSLTTLAQQQTHTLSGYIRDAQTGEALISATVYVPELALGVTSNLYGFYSLTVPAGTHTFVFSYLGYQDQVVELNLQADQSQDMDLGSASVEIEEVIVTAEKEDQHIEEVGMSQVKLNVQSIKKMPALLGEVDVIKAIQLLPGVQTVGEGTSGFYVRGGNVDQNLVLLDEAPVYNVSHLLGFFSVFNPDAVKDMKLYKGGIPSYYGGRLSSVVDIRMKEGNAKRFSGSAGIGSISSRLNIEAPIGKDKGSFMLAGRRTYVDLFLKLSSDTTLNKSKLFFYDLNGKVNFKLGEKDRIFLSSYFGRDVFDQSGEFRTDWGNRTGTIRWNHLFSPKLFSNLTYYYSEFDYFLGEPSGVDAFEWKSLLKDHGLKLDFTAFINPDNTLRFGLQSIYHLIDPGVARGIGDETIFNELKLDRQKSLENAIYVSNEQSIGDRFKIDYGLRFSSFHNFGPQTVWNFDEQFNPIDSTVHQGSDIYNSYYSFEPRIGMRYKLDGKSSVKLSYNRMAQYIQLASNTTASSPLDVWFPSSPNIKPQMADQLAGGYFRNFLDNSLEASVEVFYKRFENSIDFRDHAELLLNKQLEGELRFGEARAYGVELLLQKTKGNLTGWVGYTFSRTEKKIEGINQNQWYPARHDKTHDFSLVLSYDWRKRFNFSANWVYSTGSAVTFPTGRYEFMGTVVPVYSERNAERLPSYHRLDIATTIKGRNKWFGRIENELLISVYNVYGRKNPYSINFRQEEDNPQATYAEKTYLFGVIPSVTLNL